MENVSDKTKLQMIFINQSLENSLLITTHGCVAKEYMLLISKIPVRSGCYSSFRLWLYVQITNTMEQKQQISLTQYISSFLIALILQLWALSSLVLPFFADLWFLRFIPLNLEIILLSYVFVLLPIHYLNARSSPLLFSITSIHNFNRFQSQHN